MTSNPAWYASGCSDFLKRDLESVIAQLASEAGRRGWQVEQEQHEEWRSSVQALQRELNSNVLSAVELLHQTLADPRLEQLRDVILEYDFRRRGLRIDCVLLAPGLVVVIEFKRTKLTSADRDQVTNYAINLVEFHEQTQELCRGNGAIVVPILALTEGKVLCDEVTADHFHNPPWDAVLRTPLECDAHSLRSALLKALTLRRGRSSVDRETWLSSRFKPSSTIVDAAISLYGHHEVSAITQHAAPVAQIERCTDRVAAQVEWALTEQRRHIVLISGAPGAGKTLVGLNLAFDPRFREHAVFVTGNAPLVEVLQQALKTSYDKTRSQRSVRVPTGYAREDAALLIRNSTFKIVKAHHFLGERGTGTNSSDGRVIIFDEAQRTYEKGRPVNKKKLPDHEADLILTALEASYGDGVAVVCLLGHNQAINSGERGAIAWFEAAERRGWTLAISEETLNLPELDPLRAWARNPLRRKLEAGHLAHSMRFYRNKGVEEWAHALLAEDPSQARRLADELCERGHTLWVTRHLSQARCWVRDKRVGEQRAGLIASGQARRLMAEGLFVDQKPDIAKWMLTPSGDIRSSNMLETVQNQFQIQGLELDYTVVCWGLDLRHGPGGWSAHKLRGDRWTNDRGLEVAKNSYRVLLTRARKGMVIFVPEGDLRYEDETRKPEFYDAVYRHLIDCGARELEDATERGARQGASF